MAWINKMLGGLLAFVRRDRIEHELDDELRAFLDASVEHKIESGMRREDAVRAARLEIGSEASVKDAVRAVGWESRIDRVSRDITAWWDGVLHDVRHVRRLCFRAPGFSVVVVITLALGIGLNTAVFSVVNAVLMRPLAYPNPDRLVWVAPVNDRGEDDVVFSPDFVAWRDQATVFDGFAGFLLTAEPIDVGTEVVQARVAAVTEGFWDLAGAKFALGRPPASGEEGIVLPHATFARWFNADASIIGRSVTVNGRPNVISGVLPADFHPQLVSPPSLFRAGGGDVEFYRANVIRQPGGPGIQILSVMGSLKSGVSIEFAHRELERIRNLRRSTDPRTGGPPQVRIVPYAEKLVGDARKPLLVLQAAVFLVLLIVCGNTANLLLVRSAARQREIAVRTAIGAARGRVLQQFLVESLLLSAMGCAIGLVAGRGVIVMMQRLLPLAVPRMSEANIDARVLTFVICACVATALVYALVPAIKTWKRNIYETLKDGFRPMSAGPGRMHGRNALVIAEVAITVVLLVAAGLMVKSFAYMTAYPAGFEPNRILTMRVQFSGPRYREMENRRAFVDELLRRAAAAPGVEAVGVGSNGGSMMLLNIEGDVPKRPEERPAAVLSTASEGYASALGLRVVKGRWLTDHEPAPAFVINETLARQAFPGGDPIGRRIRLPFVDASLSTAQVVGVVADLKYSKLGTPVEPEVFIDYAHGRISGTTITIRANVDPLVVAPTLRALLSETDRTQPLFDVKPLDEALADSIAPRRLNLWLLGIFALSSLLIVILGIYGVVAYTIAQRTQEIGVRLALGATRRQVVGTVVRQGMTVTICGIALGVATAVASTRVMTAMLYAVAPTDAVTFAAVIGIVGVTGFAACCWPAIKASLVDPVVALRSE